MHKGDVYDFSKIGLEKDRVSIVFSKNIGRTHWDSSLFGEGIHSQVNIPKFNLEKLLSNMQLIKE